MVFSTTEGSGGVAPRAGQLVAPLAPSETSFVGDPSGKRSLAHPPQLASLAMDRSGLRPLFGLQPATVDLTSKIYDSTSGKCCARAVVSPNVHDRLIIKDESHVRLEWFTIV